jgi:hypothetical protein
MTSLIYFTVCAVQDSDNLLWIVAKLSSEYHSCEDTFTYPQRFFAKRDQLVGIAMCAMHDRPPKFCPNKARPASMTSRGVLECHQDNKGGTCRGPFLEAECTGCMCRIRIRRRNSVGRILSSRGQRRRQTKKCRCKTGRGIQTPESQTLRCSVFCIPLSPQPSKARAQASRHRDAGRRVQIVV